MRRHSLRRSVLLLTLAIASAPLAAQPASPPASSATGVEAARFCTRLFFAGDLVPLVNRMTPELRDKLRGLEGLSAFRGGVLAQLGAETELLSETAETAADRVVHRRVARFERATDPPVEITWAFDPTGAIAGFSVRPRPQETASRYLDYRNRTRLRLPFEGEWTVFNGGRTLSANRHAAVRNQRFALDLAVELDGKTHRGEGRELADFHAWGAAVLAPAAGKVVGRVDGLPDNPIGTTDRANPAGNHVILDHGNGEYSFLAHLQRGSLAVLEGDRVAAGQELGRVGNSGNSSEPHLHYHLQDGAAFPAAESMPAAFADYLADGQPIGLGEPQKGQRIQPRQAAARQPAGGGSVWFAACLLSPPMLPEDSMLPYCAGF